MTVIHSAPIQIVIDRRHSWIPRPIYSVEPLDYTKEKLHSLATSLFSRTTSIDKNGVSPCRFLFTRCLQEKNIRVALQLATFRLIPLKGLIHQAIDSHCPEMISHLVSLGCDPNELDAENRSPLIHAFYKGRISAIAALLIQDSVSLSWSLWKQLYFFRKDFQENPYLKIIFLNRLSKIDLPGQEGSDALCEIAQKGAVEVAERLLRNKIGLNCYSSLTGMTPLSIAAYYKQNNFLLFLLQNGATPQFAEKDGKTALHRAAQAGNIAGAYFLLAEENTLANQPDLDNNTPLHFAFSLLNTSNEAIYGSLISILLSANADPKIENKQCLYPTEMISKSYREFRRLEFMIGHTNSLKNCEWELYEGGSAKMMCEAMAEVLNSQYRTVLATRPFLPALKDCLEQAGQFDDNEFHPHALERRIQQGDLTLLPINITRRHVVYLVFFHGYYAVCNRGDEKPDDAQSIEVFSIDPACFNANLLETLQNLHSTASPNDYLYNLLPIQQLKGKNLMASFSWQELALKMQKAGNCTYAGLKAAIRASCCFYLLIQKEALPLAVCRAKLFSKELSTYSRLHFLNEYCRDKIPPNIPLIFSCWEKIARRPLTLPPLGVKFSSLHYILKETKVLEN